MIRELEDILSDVRIGIKNVDLDVEPIPISEINKIRITIIKDEGFGFSGVTEILERSLATAGDYFKGQIYSNYPNLDYEEDTLVYTDIKSEIKKLKIGILPVVLLFINDKLVKIIKEISSPMVLLEEFTSVVNFQGIKN